MDHHPDHPPPAGYGLPKPDRLEAVAQSLVLRWQGGPVYDNGVKLWQRSLGEQGFEPVPEAWDEGLALIALGEVLGVPAAAVERQPPILIAAARLQLLAQHLQHEQERRRAEKQQRQQKQRKK